MTPEDDCYPDGEFGITDVLPFADAVQPPFEIGDNVMIKPFKGCSIGAEFCRIPLEIIMIERAAVDDAVVWDVDLKGCPYLIIYCAECMDEYDLIPVDLVRDRII